MARKSTKKDTVAKKAAAVAEAVAAKVEPVETIEAVEVETAEVAPVEKKTTKKAAKAAEKKEEVVEQKEEVVEEVAEEVAEKKPAAKKTTTKKVKEFVCVQYAGNEYNVADIVERAKADYEGKKAIKEIKVYIKPEDGMAYYVINEDVVGGVDL